MCVFERSVLTVNYIWPSVFRMSSACEDSCEQNDPIYIYIYIYIYISLSLSTKVGATAEQFVNFANVNGARLFAGRETSWRNGLELWAPRSGHTAAWLASSTRPEQAVPRCALSVGPQIRTRFTDFLGFGRRPCPVDDGQIYKQFYNCTDFRRHSYT